MLSRQIIRNFMTTAVRREGHHGPTGPGSNLPFDIRSKGKLTALFIVFFGSAMAVPFLAIRRQLTK